MAPTPADPCLVLLPGRRLCLLLLVAAGRRMVLAQPPGELLDALRTANALLSLGELCREEPALDDLLPWAGSV